MTLNKKIFLLFFLFFFSFGFFGFVFAQEISVSNILIDEHYCTKGLFPFSPDEGKISINWDYEDSGSPGENTQTEYEIEVQPGSITCSSNSSSNTSQFITKLSPLNDGTCPIELNYGQNYTWRIKAFNGSQWSDWEDGPSFTTPDNPYPYVNFDFSPENPDTDSEMSFFDNSICFESGVQVDCKGLDEEDVDYLWDFGNGETDDTQGDIIGIEPFEGGPAGIYQTVLMVDHTTGGQTYTCSKEKAIQVGVSFSPPVWNEIVP